MNKRKNTKKTLDPVMSNASITCWYERTLRRDIRAMSREVITAIQSVFNETGVANDASPAAHFRTLLRQLTTRWGRRFNRLSQEIAKTFYTRTQGHTDRALLVQLKAMGFALDFNMTAEMHNASTAIIAENVSLIKSIPQNYFTQIESLVMQSVVRGGDLGTLTQQLTEQYRVTARRAQLIARDQTRKANATLAVIRQRSLGITKGIWQHTGAGQHPRADHVAASGREFDLAKGCLISGEYLLPGQKINCGCIWRPVLPFQD